MDPSFNDQLRTIIVSGLAAVPEGGWLVSGLLSLLWPETGENVWDEIEGQVEALISQKLADYEYRQVSEDLEGLKNVVQDYSQALKDSQGDTNYISEKFNVALGAFEAAKPHFMSEGYEVLLLPLLAQMANMHLSLLRDGVLFGKGWGWTDRDVSDTQAKLTAQIWEHKNYSAQWYQTGLQNLPLPTDGRNLSTRRWKVQNAYVRQMTLHVLDNSFYWPYFDPAANPRGVVLPKDGVILPKLTREIYSDPQGTSDDNPIGVYAPPKRKITNLSVWGGSLIDAVQAAYGGSWGPRMGNTSGGSNQPPRGWNGAIPDDNPIRVVGGQSGDVLNAMWFRFNSGEQTNWCGGLGGGPFYWGPSGHILTSVRIMGKSSYYGTADCAIFGFRYEDSYDVTPTTITDVHQVAAAPLPDGRLQLWAVAGDGGLYSTRRNRTEPENSAWEPWSNFLGEVGALPQGVVPQQVAAAPLSDGRLQLWAVSGQGGLYSTWQLNTDPNATWAGPWHDFLREIGTLPRGAPQQVAAARLSDGRLQLWAIDGDGGLYSTRKSSSDPNARWEPWSDFLGEVGALPGVRPQQVVTARLPDGRLQLWATDPNNVFYRTWQLSIDPASRWAPWHNFRDEVGPLSGPVPQQMIVAPLSDGRLQLWIFDNYSGLNRTWQLSTDPNKPDWAPWRDFFGEVGELPGEFAARSPRQMAVATLPDGRQQLWVVNGFDQIYSTVMVDTDPKSGRWAPWRDFTALAGVPS